MAFTKLELQLINRVVGEFCRRHSPRHLEDQLRFSYTILNHGVIVFEERRSPRSADWITMEIAKLRYLRKTNEWQLYWQRANGKWWQYELRDPSNTLDAMIQEIERDADGCFFG